MEIIHELDKISNLLMIGISILVQFIIYPSFKNPDFKNFNKFHKSYSNKMFKKNVMLNTNDKNNKSNRKTQKIRAVF